MYKIIASFLLIAGISISFVLGATVQGKADTRTFGGVIPFTTPAGLIGFFNQNNGKVYVYDTNMTVCTFEGQMETLGKPVNPIQTVNLPENPPNPSSGVVSKW